MDLNLRKARKLEAKIGTTINTKRGELNTNSTIRVNLENTEINNVVLEARNTFFDDLKLINNLVEARQEIRDLIGKANFETGVDDLISNKVLLENKLQILNNLGDLDVFNQEETEDSLTLGKKQLELGGHYARPYTSLNFFSQIDIDKIRTDKQTFTKQIEGLEDRLAELNYSSKVRLSSPTTKLLQDNNLI